MDIIIVIIGSGGVVVDTTVGTNIVIPGGGGSSSRSGRSFVANHNIIGMTILSCVGINILVESCCLVTTAVAVGMASTGTSTAAAIISDSILPINHVVVVINVTKKICGIFSTGLFLMHCSCYGYGFVK
jgi:hypothetical protein